MTEVDLCKPVIALLESKGFEVRQELPFVIGGQRRYLDVCAMLDGTLVAVTCKLRLTGALVDDAKAYSPYANRVVAAVAEPQSISGAHEARRGVLALKGIGLMYVTRDDRVVVAHKALHRANADTRGLAAAFMEAPKDGPPAGSQAAKRNTPTRNRYIEATKFVVECGPVNSVEIHAAGHLRDMTAHQMRRAIDKGEWLGVRYEGHGVTNFHGEAA